MNLAKSGLLDYTTALSVTNYLSRWSEYICRLDPSPASVQGSGVCAVGVSSQRARTHQHHAEADTSLWGVQEVSEGAGSEYSAQVHVAPGGPDLQEAWLF
jgi:hypothetical protein